MAELVMPNGFVTPDSFRTGKAYTVEQAAQLAGTTPATVRRWLLGYEAPGHRMAPVFGDRARQQVGDILLVSFLELIEIVVISGFRRGTGGGHPVSLERLRKAHEFARDCFKLPFPFASLKLSESGGHVMHEFDERYPDRARLALDIGGQWELPWPVRTDLEHVDFDRSAGRRDPFALRWFPKGREIPIVVDPRIAAGRPTIYRRGITLETITLRWRHGEPIKDIAQDYELEPDFVEEVLRLAA